jgi:hypothetical protein
MCTANVGSGVLLGLIRRGRPLNHERGRRGDRPPPGAQRLAWLIAGGLLLLQLEPPAAATAASPGKEALRHDALLILHAVIRVTTSAEYCNNLIRANPRLLTAAQQWNRRQRASIERVAAVIERTGGLSQQEQDTSNQTASAEWNALDAAHCDHLLRDIENGALDLDTYPDTAAAIKRIIGSETP